MFYICFICGVRLASIIQLRDHFTFGNHATLSKYYCKQLNCSICFDSLKSFLQHLRRVHPLPVNDVPQAVNINPEIFDANGVHINPVIVDADPVANAAEIEANDLHPMDVPIFGDDFNGIRGEAEGNISLNDFIRAVCKNAALLAARLSSVPNVNRANVTNFISLASDFLQSGIVSVLRDKVLNLIDRCTNGHQDEIFEINQMFNILSDPFESVNSEFKRLNSASTEGHFIRPVPFLMGHADNLERDELERDPFYGQYVPLRNVLKFFFDIPGMFEAVTDYMHSAESDQTVISNFIQGSLWNDVKRNFPGKIVFPLHLHFDDYQPNNCLGSHAADNELGALYACLPCLPDHMRSSIENMLLFSLFASNDRKLCGNAVAFAPAIDELIYLQSEGILLELPLRSVRVYFSLCHIVADNKANNTIQGFVESFRANFFCRICKMHRNETYFHVNSIPNYLLRNHANYEADVALNNANETGVKELCVFNRIPGYHVTKNISCDLLHDAFEGFLTYAICPVLYYFIAEREYFTLQHLHDRIDGFDYGPCEVGNKPPSSRLTIERLQTNSVNLSGSEMLCLGRYLPQMIGDLVPFGSRVWEYYCNVHEIILILTCPYFVPGTEVYLESLIREHHASYIGLFFKTLKPKHHFLLHMPKIMLQSGPLYDLCTLTSERKHRMGKLYAHVMNSRVNPPLSISVKLQLELSAHLLSVNPKPISRPCGLKKCKLQSLTNYDKFFNLIPFGFHDFVDVCKGVEIKGTLYQKGMIIVVETSELYPTFGEIVHIIYDGNVFKFVLNLKRSLAYRDHYCAYEVIETDNFLYLCQDAFVSYMPLWLRRSYLDDAKLISLKCSL